MQYNVHYAMLFFCLQDGGPDVPVILVANKIDQYGERMVSLEDGIRRFREIGKLHIPDLLECALCKTI